MYININIFLQGMASFRQEHLAFLGWGTHQETRLIQSKANLFALAPFYFCLPPCGEVRHKHSYEVRKILALCFPNSLSPKCVQQQLFPYVIQIFTNIF